MEDELEEEGKNREERKGEEQRARVGRRVYIGAHKPVLEVQHEPGLMMPAPLAVGTGTNGHISTGPFSNRD